MSKLIKLVRGGSNNPYTMPESNDIMDSSCEVYNESGSLLYRSEHWRTIPSIDLIEFGNVNELEQHGVLSAGTYCGIWNYNADLGWHHTMFNKQPTPITNANQLTYEMEIFKSDKYNPAMGNNTISQTCLHSSTAKDSGSEGCQVGLYTEFHKSVKDPNFMYPAFDELFAENEVVIIELTVSPNYVKIY
jgi:hypothetical protein